MPILIATTCFRNPRVAGPRPDGMIEPGDRFETDDPHALELKAFGFARDFAAPSAAPPEKRSRAAAAASRSGADEASRRD